MSPNASQASYDSYLSPVTPEPETVNAGTASRPPPPKRQRAERSLYGEMITNLENFPSKMTIGDDSYVGFGSSDFTLKSTDVTEDKVTKSVNTTFTLEHKSGLEFELRCVYYPDYAAFDWVIYFTNNGEENSPIVSDISPAELTFEGDNPTILSNFSDGGQYAPFLPQRLELKEGEKKTFAPSTGRSTEDAFPYYNFEYGNKGAFVVTSWSGQWQADFEYNNGVTAFSGRQQTFSSYLKPGETARTPLTAMVLYDGRDTDRATNLWRNWFIDCNMYKNDGENPPNPLLRALLRRSITKWKMPPRQIRLPVSKNISKTTFKSMFGGWTQDGTSALTTEITATLGLMWATGRPMKTVSLPNSRP